MGREKAAITVMNTSDTGEREKDTLPDATPPLGQAPETVIEPASPLFTAHSDDLNRLHQFCWMVVREPLHAAMTSQLAHCVLETICRWQPNNGVFLTALAVAQYRIGEYRAVLDSLAKSEEFIPGTPVNLAFQAMARFRLGDKAGSLALLGRLVQVVHLPPWHQDVEAAAFLREAQNLITTRTLSET
jgi:hypothetical protein